MYILVNNPTLPDFNQSITVWYLTLCRIESAVEASFITMICMLGNYVVQTKIICLMWVKRKFSVEDFLLLFINLTTLSHIYTVYISCMCKFKWQNEYKFWPNKSKEKDKGFFFLSGKIKKKKAWIQIHRLAEWHSKRVLPLSLTEPHYAIINIYFQPNTSVRRHNILNLYSEFYENYEEFLSRKIGDFLLSIINNTWVRSFRLIRR